MSAQTMPLSIFIQTMHDPPSCKTHNHLLTYVQNGGPSGYEAVGEACDCTVDLFAYATSPEFLMRTVTRLHHEVEDLKARLGIVDQDDDDEESE